MAQYMTFRFAKRLDACNEGYDMVAKALGGDSAYGMNKPIPLSAILEHAGIKNTFWCLRRLALDPLQQRDLRLFAADCAEHVLPCFEGRHPNDKRPREAIQAAKDFANGILSRGQLKIAADAAYAAANAANAANAADAAYAAAYAANAANAAYAAYAADAERQYQTEKLMEILIKWESDQMKEGANKS